MTRDRLYTFNLLLLMLFHTGIAKSETIEVVNGVENQVIYAIKQKPIYEVQPRTLNTLVDSFKYLVTPHLDGLSVVVIAKKLGKLRQRVQENDVEFSNDHIKLFVDIENNGHSAFVFTVNHQGNYSDSRVTNTENEDLDWNGDWQFSIEENTHKYWRVRFFIPWKTFSFNYADENEIGIHIERFDEHNNATFASTPSHPSMANFLQSFQTYKAKIRQQSSFDFFPFTTINYDLVNKSRSYNIGADLFWKPFSGHQLNATINPDFGQVESNELVVNFSAIESLFIEKRPFFNENQAMFNVTAPESLILVHTPRIGGSSIFDDNNNSNIEGAIRYTIKEKSFQLGILSALEQKNNVGKGRNFNALRGEYFYHNYKLGFSINVVDSPNIARKSRVVASDLNGSFGKHASYTIGVVQSKIIQNSINQQDHGIWLTGKYDHNKTHLHEFSIFNYGDTLQLNDIGYVKRVNRKQFEYEYQHLLPDFDSLFIRDMVFVFETELKTNHQNEKLPNLFGIGIELTTNSEFELQLSAEIEASGVDDLLTRGGYSVKLPKARVFELEISSPEYEWGQYNMELNTGREGWNGAFYEVVTSVNIQASERLGFEAEFSQYHSDSWLDWDEENTVDQYSFTEQGIQLSAEYKIGEFQNVRVKFEAIIGKASGKGTYEIYENGDAVKSEEVDEFSFSESALQVRYKYSFSKLSAFYLSYSFGGEYEDEYANFSRRNLYTKAINRKYDHNFFAKLRLHF